MNLVLSPIDPEILASRIADKVVQKINERKTSDPTPPPDDPLSDFIPKHEVRGIIASAATLWKMGQTGKLKGYGFGGKRYYKRSELVALFEEVKIKGL